MKVLLCLMLTLPLMNVTLASSKSDVSEILNSSEKKQTKKRSRRKKVLMCGECGKPETHCDCEGHEDHAGENAKGHGHSDSDDHKH